MILTPDVVLNTRTDLESALSSVLPNGSIPQALDVIAALRPTDVLDDVTGVIVRVKDIHIIRNKRGLIFDADADVYPILLIANGKSERPVEFSLPNMFNGIRDDSDLPIAAPGIAIQRNFDGIPDFLDIHVLIMRSLEAQRNFAQALTATLASNEGKSILDAVGKLVTGGTAGIALNIATSLLQVYLKFLGAEKDRQIFYGTGSLEKQAYGLGIAREHVFTDNKFASVTIEIIGIKG